MVSFNFEIFFICPTCRSDVKKTQEGYRCEKCQAIYGVDECGVIDFLPKNLSSFKQKEADYHSDFREDLIEIHQLQSYRNAFYHSLLVKKLFENKRGALVLEVGSGAGFDGRRILDTGASLVETDISKEMLYRAGQNFRGSEKAKFVACDAEALPFSDKIFNATLIVAALHHLPSPEKGIKEMARTLVDGGKLVVGIEPNKTYFNLIRHLRPILLRFSHTSEEGSQADRELSGFKKKDLVGLFDGASLKVEEIIPVWFFSGFLHYTLEFLYRAFKLKKRIHLPNFFERVLLTLDRLILKIPGFDFFCWHWIVVGEKG